MGFFEQLIDGGDESYQNQSRNPYSFRTKDSKSTSWYSKSYTGKFDTGVETHWGQCESRESYGHPAALLGRTNRNIGGKFVHTKIRVGSEPPAPLLRLNGTTWRESQGPLWPSGHFRSIVTTFPGSYLDALDMCTDTVPLVSGNDLAAAGATAVSRCAPTTPLVDLSTSLAELLREGLPQAPGSAGNIGGEYLNVMFGYLPLHGDLSDLAETARNADKLLRQYERDAGRWTRRRYDFTPTVTSVAGIQENASLVGAGSGLSQVGTRSTYETTRTETWFEGAFTYYLPRKGWRRTVAELDHLYGIMPGIDTVWELTGYSWLADYFVNMGDVFSNINAFAQDGLVMPYGYIMCKQHVVREETWSGNVRRNGLWERIIVSNTLEYTTHQRQLANPFGFGLTFGGLNDRQLSILAALGISRL
jgi:hypothetical protein